MSSWNSTLKFNPLWLRIGNSKYLKEEKKTSKKIRRRTYKFRCFFCLSSIIYFNICTLWLLQQIQICKLLSKYFSRSLGPGTNYNDVRYYELSQTKYLSSKTSVSIVILRFILFMGQIICSPLISISNITRTIF